MPKRRAEKLSPSLLIEDVPIDNRESTLASYAPRDDDGRYAKELAEALVAHREGPAGLMLVGATGNGKTHLAVGMARAVAEQGGRAAFISFKGSGPNFDVVPKPGDLSLSWHGHEHALVSLFDLMVIDDVPGDMMPGVRGQLQRIVMQSYNQGKKLVFTSNQPAPELVMQIAYSVDTGYGLTDMSVGVVERMSQVWQTVEFRGESFRAEQPKWWRDTSRPPAMPQTLHGLTAEMRQATNFAVHLGGAVLEIADAVGAEGSNLAALRATLEDLRD